MREEKSDVLTGENCGVSVICVTYNQEDYIRDTLDNILSQQTDFAFEILVHDDASTDGTAQILWEYQNKYPGVVQLIIERENLFSKGVDFFADMVRNMARGKYIAICEGDDYWTDDRKLQMQYDALENHPECDMCACCAEMVSADGTLMLGQVRPMGKNGILHMEEVILGGGMYLATAALFFRKSMYDNMMDFEKIRSLDYVYQMKGALRGGIYYIDRPMAAYRRYSKGSQTVQLTGENTVMVHQCEQEQRILEILDAETGGRYHEIIKERLRDYRIGYFDQLMLCRDSIYSLLSSKENIYIWGMGLRGRALEKFCAVQNIKIAGVCDITNVNIGNLTEYGHKIVSTDEALENGAVILASVNGAYTYLREKHTDKTVVNLFKYMRKS